MMRALAALAAAPIALAGCAVAPEVSDLLRPAERARQERHFQGVRAEDLRPAVVSVLQDLGFQVAASEPALGLIVATRGHDKTVGEYSAAFGKDLLQMYRNLFTLQWHAQPSNPEKVVGPAGHSAAVSVTEAASGSTVRITLHRFVRRPTGEASVIWAEEVPGPHPGFFALLAQALATSSRSPAPAPRAP